MRSAGSEIDILRPIGWSGRGEIGARAMMVNIDDFDIAVPPLPLHQRDSVFRLEINDGIRSYTRRIGGDLRERPCR
jgi:hypothetical protein